MYSKLAVLFFNYYLQVTDWYCLGWTRGQRLMRSHHSEWRTDENSSCVMAHCPRETAAMLTRHSIRRLLIYWSRPINKTAFQTSAVTVLLLTVVPRQSDLKISWDGFSHL